MSYIIEHEIYGELSFTLKDTWQESIDAYIDADPQLKYLHRSEIRDMVICDIFMEDGNLILKEWED